jgi:prepilin-type N-terminal cleavage/methylation domain-containing protein
MKPPQRAFTLVELLTTLALLVAVLGLMVSLSRHVRSASAQDNTRSLLIQLDLLMDQYVARNDGRLPSVSSLMDAPQAHESVLTLSALRNNQQFLQALQSVLEPSFRSFRDLSITGYDGRYLRDAWGTPVVFMPARHPAIGMSPKGWFFFSAGPDHRYLTREDNVYSYEKSALGNQSPPATHPE